MSKRLHSKFSVCKHLLSVYKNLWGNSKKMLHRSITKKSYARRKSGFRTLLGIKQSLKFFYCNITERRFKIYVKFSINSPYKVIDKFISLLESRLDSILFRSSFVNSFHKARQLINHGFVNVNSKVVYKPSFLLSFGDFVTLNSFLVQKMLFSSLLKAKGIPNFLEICYSYQAIFFLWPNNLKYSYFPIKLTYSLLSRYYA